MNPIFIQIIFGWPALIASILLSVVGVWLKKPILLAISGIVCLPFTYYVSNGFRSPFLFLPFFQFGSAYAVMRQKNLIAWLCIAPIVLIAVVLAYAVLSQ